MLEGKVYKFDSKKEANHFGSLINLLKMGVISELRLQPEFDIIPQVKHNGKTLSKIKYIADFAYKQNDMEIVVDDLLGKTPIPESSGTQSSGSAGQQQDKDESSEANVLQPVVPYTPVGKLPDNNKPSNKNKKSKNLVQQKLLTGHIPNGEGAQRVRDILIYDIPVS